MHSMSELAAGVPGMAGQMQADGEASTQISTSVRNLFLLMQGAYGSLFLSRFATGVLDGRGRDQGIRSAMLVWSHALSRFSAQAPCSLPPHRLIKPVRCRAKQASL